MTRVRANRSARGAAEFLYQIQGKGRASGADGVEEAQLRVQPDGFQRRPAIARGKGVQKGDEGVKAAAGRAAGAAFKREVGADLGFHDEGQHLEIAPRRVAFNAEQFVEAGHRRQLAHLVGDVLGGLDEGFLFRRFLALPRPAHQQLAAIAQFAGNERPSEFNGLRGIIGGTELRLAQQDVAAHRAFQPGR